MCDARVPPQVCGQVFRDACTPGDHPHILGDGGMAQGVPDPVQEHQGVRRLLIGVVGTPLPGFST